MKKNAITISIISAVLITIFGVLVFPNISWHKEPEFIQKNLNDLFTDETLWGIESVQIERYVDVNMRYEKTDIPNDKLKPLLKYLKDLNFIGYEERITGRLYGQDESGWLISHYANGYGDPKSVYIYDNCFRTVTPYGETAKYHEHAYDLFLYKYYYVSDEDAPAFDKILKLCGIEVDEN